ncbi:MAG: AMP-binding protein [Verrucomicrobiae bacterium]
MRLSAFPGGWLSAEEISAVRQRLLREHLDYCRRNSPFYRDLLAGIAPEAVTFESLANLPLTDKEDFSARNAEFLAVPPDRIVDIVLSSGTTGLPNSVMYSEHDLRRLAHNEALSLAACGVTRDDTALLTCTMDRCFVAGLAYQTGLRQIGAAVIRSGASTLANQGDLIRRLNPTVLVGVPTFLRKLGRFLAENGHDPAASSVRSLVCIGEPLRDAGLAPLQLAQDLEALWQAPAFSTYATSETVSTFCECPARCGGHLNPELAIVEIVDAAGRRLPAGEHGEVVLTPLQCEGMPLVRFRTGDMSFLIEVPCSCGRFTPRLGPILGRLCQMIKTKGTTVYPLAILAALNSMAGISDYYVVATSEDHLSDLLTVHAAVSDGCSPESIAEQLQSRLRVKTSVVIRTEAEIAREIQGPESRKANRFIDQRSRP